MTSGRVCRVGDIHLKTQLYLTERLGRLFRAIGAGRRRSDRVATGGSATRSRRRAAAFSSPAATLAPMTSFELSLIHISEPTRPY